MTDTTGTLLHASGSPCFLSPPKSEVEAVRQGENTLVVAGVWRPWRAGKVGR